MLIIRRSLLLLAATATQAVATDLQLDAKTKAELQTYVERTHRGVGSISGDKADGMAALKSYFTLLSDRTPSKNEKIDLCNVVSEQMAGTSEKVGFTYCTDTMITQAVGVTHEILEKSPNDVVALSSLILDKFPHNAGIERIGIVKALAYLKLDKKRKAADAYLEVADQLLDKPNVCANHDLKRALTGAGDALDNAPEANARFERFLKTCKDPEIQLRSGLSAIVANIGKDGAAHYLQARRDRVQNYYGYDQERHFKTTDGLIAQIPKTKDRSWQAFLTYIAAERSFRNPTPYQIAGARERAIEYYEKIPKEFSDAVFPIDDPEFGVRKGVQIAPFAHMRLALIYESNIDGVTSRPQHDLAAKEYEAVLEKYHDSALMDGEGSIVGNAAASLIRIYGQSDRGLMLAKRMLTEYPNVKFLWNGWWFGQTHPEALLYLADAESDKAQKIEHLIEVVDKHPDAWTGKAGSDDTSLYSATAMQKLLSLGASDEEIAALCERVRSSKAGKVPKAIAIQRLARTREYAKDAPGAISLYSEIVKTYPSVSYGYEEEPFSKDASERIIALQKTPPEFIQGTIDKGRRAK
jgi:tetratricopeptide (TPR) repeat protein